MSAPLPEGALHLLVADEGVTEGRWYGEYLTLCHELVPTSGLPPSLCPDRCDQQRRFCPACVREAARPSTGIEQPPQDARDTHRGELSPDGTVVAQCGIRFVPRPLLLGRMALPGHPQDRDQICPQYQRVKRTR